MLFAALSGLIAPAVWGAVASTASRRPQWAGVVLLLLALPSFPQSSPQSDALIREVQRQQERERDLRERMQTSPNVTLPQALVTLAQPDLDLRRLLPTAESPCVEIKSIELAGEAADRFQWALSAAKQTESGVSDSPLDRCLGVQAVNLVLKRMQNAILKRGYITTVVVLEPQNVAETKRLRVTLIPGRIKTLQFNPEVQARARLWNAFPSSAGDLLNLRDLEQGLENLKRVPTADADIAVAPAERSDEQVDPAKNVLMPGESDIELSWGQRFALRLNLSLDDSGTKATGKYLGGITISVDNPTTLNDLFYVSFNHDLGGGNAGARGTRGYAVHYSIPYGYWLLGFNASQYNFFQSIAGANQTFVFSGDNETQDIRLSRLVYRDAVRKTTLSLRGWIRKSNTFIDDVEIEIQRRRMAGWEIGVNHREVSEKVTVDLNANYRRGTGLWGSLPAPEEASGEGTARPKLLTADAQVNIPFQALGGQRMRYLGAWRGQREWTPLVPQDRFAIGGRYTVRGFDGERLLSAERGWLFRNDIAWVPEGNPLEIYLGLDHGRVGGRSAQALVGRSLTGAVVGLRGGYKNVAYDFFLGSPLKKPAGFVTSRSVAGFSLSLSL